jgi:hypothetical protein
MAAFVLLLLTAACSINPLPTPARGDTAGGVDAAAAADVGPLAPDAVAPDAVPDVVAPDAALDVALDAVPPPDSAFCGSESRVELDDARFAPVSVTTAEYLMDCCTGFATRFHAASADGIDVSVLLMVPGLDSFVGELDLARLPDGIPVLVRSGAPAAEGDAGWRDFDGTLAGTLSVRDDGAAPMRRLVSLCLTGERAAPVAGAAFQRLRLSAADVGLLVPRSGGEAGFALYLLVDPEATAVAAAALPLADLELAAAPVVDLSGVESYELATHGVALPTWRSGEGIRATLPPVGTQGLPFVVVSGDERLYLGAFWTMVSSEAFPHPVVVVESIDRLGFRIEGGYPNGPGDPPDPRADPRLLAALRYAGKLVE